jgi:hypothetical protein
MLGRVDALGLMRAWVWLRGAFGSESVEAIIDTGFTGSVSIPTDLARRLGLPRYNAMTVQGPDGSLRVVRTYLVEVQWIAGWTHAQAWENGVSDVMVGAALLRGHKLIGDYGPAQSVEVR